MNIGVSACIYVPHTPYWTPIPPTKWKWYPARRAPLNVHCRCHLPSSILFILFSSDRCRLLVVIEFTLTKPQLLTVGLHSESFFPNPSSRPPCPPELVLMYIPLAAAAIASCCRFASSISGDFYQPCLLFQIISGFPTSWSPIFYSKIHDFVRCECD